VLDWQMVLFNLYMESILTLRFETAGHKANVRKGSHHIGIVTSALLSGAVATKIIFGVKRRWQS
jgi:hypothetical protein